MHLDNLKLVVTEGDLNEWALGFLPRHEKLRALRIVIESHAIRVSGTYQWAIAVPFETRWDLSICEGKLAARLLSLKTGFLSVGLAKSYVLGAIAATVRIVESREDMLLLDVDRLCRDWRVPLRTNLSSVRCDYGNLIFESGRTD